MTATALSPAADETLVDATTDVALATLLNSRASDDIPTSVWWLVGEALHTSVELRRCVTTSGHLAGDADSLAGDAMLLTQAALDELAETTGAQPTAMAEPASREPRFSRQPSLRLSTLLLTRLLVSRRPVGPQRLANTLAAHQRALRFSR
ncbi:MAG TPA: hypothetical protein VG708_15855 [Mycobacteriales bacterium]|nr:hypothetical protein [Mycobacteriales bacterium]